MVRGARQAAACRGLSATISFLTRYHPSKLAFAACAAFFLSAQPFIPRLGVEDDEALFAMPILQPRNRYTFVLWALDLRFSYEIL